MLSSSLDRPPYRAALAVFAIVLAGFFATLAPTVTFWDAGELIAAARTLGIPHPPGTPLFVLIAHVWGMLLPVGEFAWRTNLLSATLSAAGSAFFFLVAHETLGAAFRDLPASQRRILQLGGGAAAAITGAFTFTNWQNSNETEVYTVATLSIALLCWLCLRWRARRGTPAADRMLLLIVYLGGISMGNHLLALLVGPAVVMFMWATLRIDPAANVVVRRGEWARTALIAGVWALLVGTGLGSATLTVVGLVCFLAAAGFAAASGATRFAVMTLLIAAIGVTPYLFLYLRAAQGPMLNEADPSTWDALLAVIRRAQYPVRTPLDDPTVYHGPDNPGRSLRIIGLQLVNYVQYFNWQWARVLGDALGSLATALFIFLGGLGWKLQRRHDRAAWWLLVTLFLVTGLGLVAYMNFRPGFSIGYQWYPSFDDHEVRERDYFFVVSFVVWGLWAGIGMAALARALAERLGEPRRRFAPAVLVMALVPVVLNFGAASRRHGPDARFAADFAYDLLNSTPPYGILFTYGDNDTFPLWWAQEVQGIRRDVTVVCLALANTEWYMRQLRDHPVRELDRAALPPYWHRQAAAAAPPDWPLHTLTDDQIAQTMYAIRLPQPLPVVFPGFTEELPAGTELYPNDVLAIRVLQQNLGRRPVMWAVTAGRKFGGLSSHAVQKGLVFEIAPAVPDTTAPGIVGGVFGPWPVDVPVTDSLVWQVYRYGDLLKDSSLDLEPTAAAQARAMALPFTALAFAYHKLGDRSAMLRNLDRAVILSPNPAMEQAAQQLRLEGAGAE